MVTLQELDIKTRNRLEQSFNIYNKDIGDIKKGIYIIILIIKSIITTIMIYMVLREN
ncbi:exotoxin beta-grasp domain-containing protein [Staphylococcus agnetis]|uniref:exotoxin beta-grasp domain-containing protein n=1 Tax=Staphylococcus agnetis TaxID=985762 RepID=UPI00338FD567